MSQCVTFSPRGVWDWVARVWSLSQSAFETGMKSLQLKFGLFDQLEVVRRAQELLRLCNLHFDAPSFGFRFHSTGRMLSTSAACRRRLTLGLWLRCGIPWGWDCSFNESSLSWLGRQRGIIRKWLVINIIYILTICILIIYKPVIQRGIIRRWLVCRWRGWLGGSWRKEVQKNI